MRNKELFNLERELEDVQQDILFVKQKEWEEQYKLQKYMKKRHPRKKKVRKLHGIKYSLPF